MVGAETEARVEAEIGGEEEEREDVRGGSAVDGELVPRVASLIDSEDSRASTPLPGVKVEVGFPVEGEAGAGHIFLNLLREVEEAATTEDDATGGRGERGEIGEDKSELGAVMNSVVGDTAVDG